jgi:UDP-glucose 4-epimerase
MQRFFITGGAGFIGSNLVDRLLADANYVTAYDNFSTGQRRFLESAIKQPNFRLIEGDTLDESKLGDSIKGHDFVFHLAANADVRFGTDHPRRDLEQNTIATHNVLEAMRANDIKSIAFSSTGSVYGEASVFPTPEDAPFPVQTSLYAASKLAGEALIAAYCSGFGFRGYIYRFVSILGERYSHGHVYDFVRQLRSDPTRITVLGNGKQRKSYLYVQDCISAMLSVIRGCEAPFNLFNLGAQDYCTVDDSLGWICQRLGVQPHRQYSGGERGWIGDSPFIFLDTSRIQSLGWMAKLTIRQGVFRTVDYLMKNDWLFESRS